MTNITKPKLLFFQSKPDKNLANFVLLYRLQQLQCLSEFFEVTVIQENCDYQQVCDKYQPDLTLFENPGNFPNVQKLDIKNTHCYSDIPKLGFYNEDAWCSSRKEFISDMERWGIETFFSICTTIANYTPENIDNVFVWPNFVNAEIYKDYGVSKNIPVLLTGASYNLYPWRQKVYKLVSENYPSLICPHLGYSERSKFRMLYGEQYARTINAAWFVPTCGTATNEVVRKHFEIPASKACLITERTASLEAAGFVDMENCVFASDRDVIEKIDYLFQNLDRLESIIDAGYQLAHSRHTLKHRNQIIQWFNLYKDLKPNQKIIQSNPFEQLSVVEKFSGIRSSHIISNGINITLLNQGDEKLRAGCYNEAEELYLKSLDYVSIMPEPKLKLALCSLYKGDAKKALEWLVPIVKTNVNDGRNSNPDPIEWAYCIIALLCLGKFDEALGNANRFPSLKHPELNRVRWAIAILTGQTNTTLSWQDEQVKTHYSIHKLCDLSFDEWLEQVCIVLNSCQQFDIGETLMTYGKTKVKLLKCIKTTYSVSASKIKLVKRQNLISKIVYTFNPYPFKHPLVARLDRMIFKVRKKLAIKTHINKLLARTIKAKVGSNDSK